ncbi:FtsX-like permease family protein [Brevibacterium casei]|uniref:FtsX-like permease family protein n=1 Tax=Brevibacterium casei CIP 102111 TaxID=1255625 RepID=A0A2H1HJ15_9MICO|nr:FtsX-like permease family protein [Brevibacterium casei]MCT1551670.1 FtsX-like permease family protein [Brevibacterium casei]MCT1561174.1 FtsX-like permease family protein [Brevibacterium casei]MCT2209411.1 FtsX-like permease family protein [Brevibacterium casei]QPR38822.1 FtsX-like permease family protein [Brevibacterium casei]QPR42987.1 FtsX-like permease family protein [Brevibacterium casei]
MPTMNVLSTVLSKQTFTSPTARLVAIAFFACSTLFLTVAAGAWAFNDRPEVPGYAEVAELYRMLAVLATVFLIVPAVSLGVASAKLSARRQDERLSTLSLLGASKGTIRLIAVAEPFVPAAAGILAGIGGYLLLAYPLSLLVFTGVPLGYSALLMPVWLLAAVVVGLLLVCLLSALLGLRKVIVSPLGVRTRSLARKFPLVRIITVIVLALGMVGALVFSLQDGQRQMVVVIASIATIGIALLLINVLGVLIMMIHAAISSRIARRPAAMLSASMIADAPAQYWRRVAGLALITFIAVVGGAGAAMMRGNAGDMSPEEIAAMGPLQYTGDDVFTGLVLTLAIAFVFIVVSATINQAADILDRATTYRELHAAGMTQSMMHRVTVGAVMSPILLVTLVSLVLGGLLAAAMASAGDLGDPMTIGVVAAVVAGGVAMVWLGLQFTRPLVRRVTAVAA